MNIGAIFIGIALLVLAIPFVANPFLEGRKSKYKSGAVQNMAAKMIDVSKQRETTLLALRDLDFDYRTGKVTEEDYNNLRAQLVIEAASFIEEAEQVKEDPIESRIRSRKEATNKNLVHAKVSQDSTKCRQCGGDLRPIDQFCPSCGTAVYFKCPSCGKVAPVGDLFCSSCGSSIQPIKVSIPG